MRRFAFYLFTGLAAFCMGYGGTLFFGQKSPLNLPKSPNYVVQPKTEITASPEEAVEEGQPVLLQKTATKFVCHDKALRFVLDRLRNNKEINEDLGEDGQSYVEGFISGFKIENCNQLFEVPKNIDLNSDGRSEVIVRAKNNSKGMFFCGATGNCSMWVL